jgi:hypothetical protein
MTSPLGMEYSLQPPTKIASMPTWGCSIVLNVTHIGIQFHTKKLHTMVCNSYLKHNNYTQKQTHIFHTQSPFSLHYDYHWSTKPRYNG